MKTILVAVSVILTIILTDAANTVAQYKISVTGIVVDEKGRPVRDVWIGFFHDPSECKDCHDQVIPGYKTGDEGAFFLDDTIRSNPGRLYIENTPPKGYSKLVSPPDKRALWKFPELRGMSVKLPKNAETVHLGEVRPNIVYAPVSIDLLRLFRIDKQAFDTISSLKVSIYYKGVTVWNKLPLSEKSVDLVNARTVFSLPQGNWKLVFYATQKDQVLATSTLVKVVDGHAETL